MTLLADIIEINATPTDAAIVIEYGLANQNLVRYFTPTQAAVKVLNHLCAAVLPQATQEQRALNLFGGYGSGKSHFGVLLAQLLRDGSSGEAFAGLFQRLHDFGEAQLAQNLQNTFLAAGDADAKPYLLVSLYGSEAPSLAAQLMEGLYDALERHPDLNHQAILPTTEYAVCVKRFDEMVDKTPALATAALPRHIANDYATTEEMRVYLGQHKPEALAVFKAWHKEITHGALFNPANEGGKGFIEAYLEAGKSLAEQHQFGGIVVLWDEFGAALEDLIGNPHRHAAEEISELQRFVEKACKPAQGHTLFIGLSHVSFREYADEKRMNASPIVQNRLEAIAGRFREPFKIALNAGESEGYHLLGMQRAWTTQGKQLLAIADDAKQQLLDSCKPLPMFNKLGAQLAEVLNEVYPLHPMTAAGLFALADYAQANRTALTFFRDNAAQFLRRELSEAGLFTQELIRLPELVDYYLDKIKEKKATDWERYERALGKIPAELPAEQRDTYQAILKLCLLTELLGENFQTTEGFLASALYDSGAYNDALMNALAGLKAADLLWKNEHTQQWTLCGDTGVNIDVLIAEQVPHFAGRGPETLLVEHPDMLEDLLPQVGEHELEPSACGIVRSYRVSLLTSPITNQRKLDNPLVSGQVFLVLANTPEEADIVKARIQETATATVYFWLPLAGIRAEAVTIEGKDFKLSGLLCRYLALEVLLKQKTNSEELRRQLLAKWERTRQEALALLRVLYGRDGLQSGKSQIFKAGTADALSCNSWHEVRRHLAEDVQAAYPQEVPIRANNMNKLNDEKYTGSKKVLDMVERILNFDSNKDYQTDLLGENGSSEASALIDGVLGANGLFIQRPGGWDIKKPDETSGGIHAVLQLIHDTLLRKHETPYGVKKLRDRLIAPPYGIPACNLALFAAVAIRHEAKRLRWGSTKEMNFAKNLTGAFDAGSKITSRLFEFGAKQFAMLYAVGEYFGLQRTAEQTSEEYATACSHSLRDFVKGQAEAVRHSRLLQDETQQLVKFCNLVGKNPQDMADFLMDLLAIEGESAGDIGSKSVCLLQVLLDEFAKIENVRRYEIEHSWQTFVASIDDKDALLIRLSHERATYRAKAIAGLLRSGAAIDADKITRALLNIAFEQCDDRAIGKCQDGLENLLDYHPPSPQPTPLPPIIVLPPEPPIEPPTEPPVDLPPEPPVVADALNEPDPTPKILTSIPLIDTLRTHIDTAKVPRSDVQEILQQLLNEYRLFWY